MADQLHGLNFVDKQIILQINSAYGFGLVRGSIEIHSTFMNQKHITVLPLPLPVHQNELKLTSNIIWYMDNATLKKSKMSNTSIKVECFHIPINKSDSNEKLGYLLLKVKGAQTINPTSNDRIENKTYKLIGSKNGSYDLNLSLRIEDFNDKDIDKPPEKIKNLKFINNKNKNDLIKGVRYHQEVKNDEGNFEIDLPKSDVKMLEQKKNLPENNKTHNVLIDIQQQLIEELEDWKDKQIILFNQKMKIKEENLLKEFDNKCLNDRKHIEEELTYAMSKCTKLAKDLDKMSDMLKERDAIVTAKELELACQKDSMENKYIGLVQNMQSSNAQIINELSNKNVELETKLLGTEKNNILLRKENEMLTYDIKTSCGLQVQELEKTISNLEFKIEESNKSCMFFKERWIASVRRINEMYTKFHETKTNEHLLNNKQNIQNILSNQLEERQQDKQKFKTLLKGLRKLRQLMTSTNYLDL